MSEAGTCHALSGGMPWQISVFAVFREPPFDA